MLSKSCKLCALIRSDEYLFGSNNENLAKIISIVKEVSQSNFLYFTEIWIYPNIFSFRFYLDLIAWEVKKLLIR